MWLVREKEREEELRKYNEANGIEENNYDEPQVYEYKISIWTQLYYNKIVRGVIIILIVALIVPISLLLFMDVDDPLFDGSHTCSYITDYQILCGKQNTTLRNCLERKCCFNETDKSCFHTVPSYYQYRILTKKTRAVQTSIESEPIMATTPFGGTSHKKAYLYYDKITAETLSITLSENKPPTSRKKASQTIQSDYNVMIFSKEVLAIEVNRAHRNQMLLSTAHGPLIISEKYWEWSVDLEAEHLFGMDFLRHPDNETITRVIYKNVEDHTTVPKFIAYRNGSFHGLEIYHSGPLEVSVSPSRLIVLRLLAGGYLTLHLSIGPTIDDILRQQGRTLSYASLPYWVLGVHMCRGGITNETALLDEYTKTFTYNKNIPYDSDCIHENLFTISKNVPTIWSDAIAELKADNKRFIMSLAPQILTESPDDSAYKEANKLGILYKTSSNQTLLGNYLNESVAYPDYASQEAKSWFMKLYSEKFAKLAIDGVVLRDNWPVDNASFFKDVKRQFQYMNDDIGKQMNKTLPWDSLSTTGIQHIETHNSYGYNFALSTPSQQIPFVLTASHTTDNKFAVHAQHVNVSWANFKSMLQRSISHSLLNGPLFSLPICGSTRHFSQEQNQAVCSRWYLAAATMPLFRISSDMPRRDPYSFKLNGNNYMHNLALQAIQTRYKLLPYYYTVLAEHPMLIRPMFYDFHSDNNTFLLDEQYMIGDSLLVAQPTLFPIPNIKVYFPEIPGGWYEFWGGAKMTNTGYVTVSIVEADLVVYIAGGKITPIQNTVGNSAEESRKQPLKLIVALDNDEKATGKYYMENNIIHFNYVKDTLKIINVEVCPTTSTTPDKIVNLHLQTYGNTTVSFCKVKDDLCFKLNNEVTITTVVNGSQQSLLCDNK